MNNLPAHPLKAIGEAKRREANDDVCTECGHDLREADGELICPSCITRGDPDLWPKKKYLSTERLLMIKQDKQEV